MGETYLNNKKEKKEREILVCDEADNILFFFF